MQLEEMFHIKEKSWYEIISWAKLAYDEDKNEISGLATAVPDKDGFFIIGDVEIMKQENSGSNTELDGDAVTAYKMKYGMKHKNPNMKFVWWHSHHTMDAFWSGTDVKEIEAWENDSFSLALVVNLKEEYKFRVSVWKAAGLNIAQHYDIPLSILRKNGIKVTDKMKEEYEELCSDKHSYVTHHNNWKNNNQTTIWNNSFGVNKVNRPNWNDMNKYSKTLELIESAMDEFMSDSLSFKDFNDQMKFLNSEIKNHNIKDYKIKIPKGSKQALINKLESCFPEDLLEFKDNDIKESYVQNVDVWGGNYGYLY
tara:strand:+ start:3061 stop:3990 length:930 start_codon:yes stop_codon:yes gene_type:complete